MRPPELTASLAAFERRGAGTDAERRAARWLASELRAAGQQVRVEPFWCRPNWALAHAWHAVLALAGSLLSVSHPTLGVVLLAVALASVLADELTGVSLGRRLTPERASQNVVAGHSRTGQGDGVAGLKPATLTVTANYDAGRTALVHRDTLRRLAASLRRLAGPFALGWLAWLSLAIVWLLAIAVVRMTTHGPSHALGVIQLPPTVALVLALALLLEAAAARSGRSDSDNASGVAVATALVHALQAAPPRNVAVQLVLAGAGEGHEIGIRTYLKKHRRDLGPADTIVLGIAPCGGGEPRWWRSDGQLIPFGYTRRLRELARGVANDDTREHHGAAAHDDTREHHGAAAHDGTRGHRGRGGTPALPARARLRPLPAITIGNLDARGLPRATLAQIDPANLSDAIEFGLALVEAVDAALDADRSQAASAPTPA